jgi:hypothetical protein
MVQTKKSAQRTDGNQGSPQANSQAQQRTRIIEPHRMKFEKVFEKYMEGKYVN